MFGSSRGRHRPKFARTPPRGGGHWSTICQMRPKLAECGEIRPTLTEYWPSFTGSGEHVELGSNLIKFGQTLAELCQVCPQLGRHRPTVFEFGWQLWWSKAAQVWSKLAHLWSNSYHFWPNFVIFPPNLAGVDHTWSKSAQVCRRRPPGSHMQVPPASVVVQLARIRPARNR